MKKDLKFPYTEGYEIGEGFILIARKVQHKKDNPSLRKEIPADWKGQKIDIDIELKDKTALLEIIKEILDDIYGDD